MSGKVAAAAANAAATAAKSASSADAKSAASGIFNRIVVAPVMNTLHKIEASSQKKNAAVEPAAAEWIAKHASTGEDAASTATKQYMKLQGQLMHYRVVRLFEETRHVVSGEYFKDYGYAKAVVDARFLTQLFFIFICAVMFGRRTVFSPIAPDSPFAVALDHKVNPNY